MSDEAEKRWPCSVETTDVGAREVLPCWVLGEHLDFQGGRGTKAQGLTMPFLVNMETHKHSRSPIVLKGGKHTKGGTQLNYCPFCGASISTHDAEDEE